MIQKVDLNKNKNLFVVSVILIAGVGGLEVSFNTANGVITITKVACALILGILTNLLLKNAPDEGVSESGKVEKK
jgi:uracil permease